MMQKYYTYDYCGFNRFVPILAPTYLKGDKTYGYLLLEKTKEAVEKFMFQNIADYMVNVVGGKDFKNQFYGGVVYFMDGGAYICYNGFQEGQEDQLFASYFDPDYFRTAVTPSGLSINSNRDFIEGIFNARHPRAVLLLQETESPKEGYFSFRVIHDRESDEILEK